MYKSVKKHFDDFANDVERYRVSVEAALTVYAKEKAEAQQTYNEKVLPSKLKMIKAKAKSEIECAFLNLHHLWNECYDPLLRDEIWNHVKQEPPKAALDRLRIYNEFGVPMTKTDASYFLHELSGTHTGVVALVSVAKKSGLNIKAPDISQYERDVEEIGKGVCHLSRYCPEGHWQDFAELNIETTNIDSLAFDPNRPGHRGLAMAQNNEFIPNLQKIAQRWSTNFVPELIDDAAMNDEERKQAMQKHAEALEAAADQIKIDDGADVKLGAKLGKQKAAAYERATNTVQAYATGAPGTGGAR